MDSAVEAGAKVFEVIVEGLGLVPFSNFVMYSITGIAGFCKGLDCLPQSARKSRQWSVRGNNGYNLTAL